MEVRLESCRWADRNIKTYRAAPDSAIKGVSAGIIRVLEKFQNADTGRLQKITESLKKQGPVDINDLEKLGGGFPVFLKSHTVRTPYTFQIRKIKDCTCDLCNAGHIKEPQMQDFFETINWLPAPVPDGNCYKGFNDLDGLSVQPQHVPSKQKHSKAKEAGPNAAVTSAKCYMTCSAEACGKPRVMFAKGASMRKNNGDTRKLIELLKSIDNLGLYECGMKCEELLTLTDAHFAHVKESLTHFSTNIELKDALAELSQRLVFDEKIQCDVYVEAAYYATNNGFTGPFSRDWWADKCPGCLGPPGAKTATDRTTTWSVRVCSRCQRDDPGNKVAVYHGKSSGGSRKRAAAADPPVED